MKVLGNSGLPERGSVITIGAFDGVHIGHRALIDATRQRGEQLGVASAVVTFDRHPASVVRPGTAPKLLTDLDQKLELLAETGIDYTMVVPFDKARADEPAENFVEDVLVRRLNAKAIVVGYDFHFGKARRGNVAMLKELGGDHGFDVDEFDAVSDASTVVSSTTIRNALNEGDIERANRFLGRAHEVRGLVTMGDGRGRELGYPTANVHVADDILLPVGGVYAGEYVLADGSIRKAAISLGTRPTFYADGVDLLEAHLLDFEGDLYGQHARVRFVKRLRSQVKFDSVDALVAQMNKDVTAIR